MQARNTLLALSLLASAASCTQDPTSPEWVPLFDGKTFAGWRAYQGDEIAPESWRIEDGAIVSMSTPGEIITETPYRDFDLRFEWKVTTGANSGVFYRVTEAGKQIHHTGLEYQVLDNIGQAGRPLTEQAAACYGVIPASTDATRPVGEWNEAMIVVRGDHITHKLNGQTIANFEFGGPTWKQQVSDGPLSTLESLGQTRDGHIALQNYHGHEVAFRELHIRTGE